MGRLVEPARAARQGRAGEPDAIIVRGVPSRRVQDRLKILRGDDHAIKPPVFPEQRDPVGRRRAPPVLLEELAGLDDPALPDE